MVVQDALFKKISVLLLIGLLLSLTCFNAFNFYKLYLGSADPVQQAPVVSFTSQQKKIATPQTIAGWYLFGKNNPAKVTAPKTTLRLKLNGIISSTVDGEARVIIEMSARKQKHFKVGDTIKQNVVIKAIHADHIVIIHNSREEIVPMNTLNSKTDIIKKVVTQ